MGFRRLNWFVWALTLVAVAVPAVDCLVPKTTPAIGCTAGPDWRRAALAGWEGTAPVRLSAPAFYLSWLRTQLSHERLTAAAVVGGRDGNSSSAVEFLEAPAGGSASSATIESTGKVPVADAWLVPSYRLSDLAAGSGEAADVSHLVYADRGLAWWDVPHPMRDALAIISTRAVAVPIGAGPLLLWYRGDVLGALAAEVPRTWQQLLAFAERYAASRQPGQPQHALCLPLGPDCTHLHLLSAVWASVAQTRSRRQGLAFDPWAGAPRIDTAGLRYALELLANLTRHSEPSWRQQGAGGSGCGSGASNSPFTLGACALTLATVGLARDADGPPGDLGASVRVASAPGSGVVWSPTSGKLVDCTKKACPLGEGLPTAGGVWVNYSPQLTAASLTGVIRASAPAEQQFKAYVVLTLLATGDALGTADLLGPVRGSELWPTADPGPDGAGLRGEAWRLSALAITHPNAGWETSIPRIQILRDELAQLLSRAQACAIVSQAGQQTCGDILGQALQASQARIAVAYPPAEFLQWYQAHLHLDHATHDWGTDASTDAAADQGGTGSRVVVVAVASSLCGALLVVALLLLMQRRRLTLLGHVVSKLMPQRRSEAMAPGPSQDACLVITDIQDSTALWEALPAAVMDASVGLHHACLRRLLLKHWGYESATEGDSFILAFRRSCDALAFALDAQTSLLQKSWPERLLEEQRFAVTLGEWLARAAVRGASTETGEDAAASRVARTCIFRGLRVRIGVSCGPTTAAEVSHNAASQRTVYSGPSATIAKQVSDAAHGGMITLSGSVVARLGAPRNRAGANEEPQAKMPPYWAVRSGRYELDTGGPTDLYVAWPEQLTQRMALLPPPRCAPKALMPTIYEAPVAEAALAYLLAPHLPTLLAWDEAAARAALATLCDIGCREAVAHGGYLAMAPFPDRPWTAGGLSPSPLASEPPPLIAAFRTALDAACWALSVQDALAMAEWPPTLLAHELCRETVLPLLPTAGAGDTYSHQSSRTLSQVPSRSRPRRVLPLSPSPASQAHRWLRDHLPALPGSMRRGGPLAPSLDREASDSLEVQPAQLRSPLPSSLRELRDSRSSLPSWFRSGNLSGSTLEFGRAALPAGIERLPDDGPAPSNAVLPPLSPSVLGRAPSAGPEVLSEGLTGLSSEATSDGGLVSPDLRPRRPSAQGYRAHRTATSDLRRPLQAVPEPAPSILESSPLDLPLGLKAPLEMEQPSDLCFGKESCQPEQERTTRVTDTADCSCSGLDMNASGGRTRTVSDARLSLDTDRGGINGALSSDGRGSMWSGGVAGGSLTSAGGSGNMSRVVAAIARRPQAAEQQTPRTPSPSAESSMLCLGESGGVRVVGEPWQLTAEARKPTAAAVLHISAQAAVPAELALAVKAEPPSPRLQAPADGTLGSRQSLKSSPQWPAEWTSQHSARELAPLPPMPMLPDLDSSPVGGSPRDFPGSGPLGSALTIRVPHSPPAPSRGVSLEIRDAGYQPGWDSANLSPSSKPLLVRSPVLGQSLVPRGILGRWAKSPRASCPSPELPSRVEKPLSVRPRSRSSIPHGPSVESSLRLGGDMVLSGEPDAAAVSGDDPVLRAKRSTACGASEPVLLSSGNPGAGPASRWLWFTRGLRVQAGIDVGRVEFMVQPATGVLVYTGGTAARALKLATRAAPGQVVLSERAQAEVATAQDVLACAQAADDSAVHMGSFKVTRRSATLNVTSPGGPGGGSGTITGTASPRRPSEQGYVPAQAGSLGKSRATAAAAAAPAPETRKEAGLEAPSRSVLVMQPLPKRRKRHGHTAYVCRFGSCYEVDAKVSSPGCASPPLPVPNNSGALPSLRHASISAFAAASACASPAKHEGGWRATAANPMSWSKAAVVAAAFMPLVGSHRAPSAPAPVTVGTAAAQLQQPSVTPWARVLRLHAPNGLPGPAPALSFRDHSNSAPLPKVGLSKPQRSLPVSPPPAPVLAGQQGSQGHGLSRGLQRAGSDEQPHSAQGAEEAAKSVAHLGSGDVGGVWRASAAPNLARAAAELRTASAKRFAAGLQAPPNPRPAAGRAVPWSSIAPSQPQPRPELRWRGMLSGGMCSEPLPKIAESLAGHEGLIAGSEAEQAPIPRESPAPPTGTGLAPEAQIASGPAVAVLDEQGRALMWVGDPWDTDEEDLEVEPSVHDLAALPQAMANLQAASARPTSSTAAAPQFLLPLPFAASAAALGRATPRQSSAAQARASASQAREDAAISGSELVVTLATIVPGSMEPGLSPVTSVGDPAKESALPLASLDFWPAAVRGFAAGAAHNTPTVTVADALSPTAMVRGSWSSSRSSACVLSFGD